MHPECVWTTHAGLVLRRDEYIFRNTTTVTWRAQEVDVDAVVVSEGTAVVVGTVTDTVVEDHEDARYRMPITMVWIRDEHWRLLAAHAGPRT